MSPRRRLMLIALAVIVLVTSAIVIVPRLLGSDAEPVAQDRPGPVLLVPGYGGGTASLEVLAAALRQRGRDAAVVRLVGDGTGDLRAQADVLAAAVDQALTAGAPSVDVVGYSAGGVVARLWADELGGADLARRIVTLGSPHHGAEIAAFGASLGPGSCPAACEQLAPGSELLTGLEETPDGPRWTALWTTADDVVTPPTSGELSGAVNIAVQDVCPDSHVGHGELPTDPATVGLVLLALDGAPLDAAPSSSQCADIRATGAAALR
jgi:triacylglycerol lipase